jgi:hypothetical protein
VTPDARRPPGGSQAAVEIPAHDDEINPDSTGDPRHVADVVADAFAGAALVRWRERLRAVDGPVDPELLRHVLLMSRYFPGACLYVEEGDR